MKDFNNLELKNISSVVNGIDKKVYLFILKIKNKILNINVN